MYSAGCSAIFDPQHTSHALTTAVVSIVFDLASGAFMVYSICSIYRDQIRTVIVKSLWRDGLLYFMSVILRTLMTLLLYQW